MPDFLSIMPMPNTTSPANPASTGYSGPVFGDILKLLQNQNGFGGEGKFQQGIQTLAPSQGFDPAYQSMIDQIRSNAGYYGGQAASQAQALAGRRGLAGSSIEQFGTQTALDNVNRTAADQEAQVRLQDLARRQQLQDATGAAYFNRAGQEGTLQGQNTNLAAQLTSDEIASLRNSYFADQQLKLQQLLGQQGIDVARQNIDASRQISDQQSRLGLIGSIGSAIIPSLLGGLGGGGGAGGGGGGILSSLFGMGAGAGTVGGVANPGATGAASSLFPGGLGPVGTSAAVPGAGLGIGSLLGGAGLGYAGATAGRSLFGGGNDLGGLFGGGLGLAFGGPIGAGIGAFAGTALQRAGEAGYKGLQNAIGNTGASYFKPLLDPVGAVKSVSKAVSKVFPF